MKNNRKHIFKICNTNDGICNPFTNSHNNNIGIRLFGLYFLILYYTIITIPTNYIVVILCKINDADIINHKVV